MRLRFGLVIFALALLATGIVRTHGATATPKADAYDWSQWQKFWSLQPVQKPAVPTVKNAAWARNPIDAFVLAKLEAQGLSPAPEANKYTLLRRLTFDLTGLPPSVDEIRAFVNDKSDDAYEKLVDRLLASPHYGERWGRHWLDVARYTQGRITFPGVKRSSGDQPYRDYVVRAFNNDKPYDQFVTEQLAGDLLPPAADRQQYFDQIIAPSFLSIGAWFDMETDPNRLRLEMIDEQINTTTKAFLGLSVACARCHDHKFDPIPTADYYKLGGIFKSTRLVGEFSDYWRDGRVRQLRPLAMPDEVAANDAIRKQIDAKKAQWWDYLTKQHTQLTEAWKADEAKYRAAAARVSRPYVKLFEAEDFNGQTGLRIAQLMRDGKGVEVIETLLPKAQWVKYIPEVTETAKYRLEALYSTGDRTPIMLTVNGTVISKEVLSEPTGGGDLQYQRWTTLGTFELREGMNFIRLDAREGNFPRVDRFRLYKVDPAVEAQIKSLADADRLSAAMLANFVYDPEQPWPQVAGIAAYLDEPARAPADALTAEMDRLAETIKPYDLTISVTDQAKPADLPVHPRGSTYRERDEPNPRGVLRLTEHALPSPAVPANHSGRLELAQWLTDPRNPLTARVMVNRLWHWHFGRGIVSTTSDFGSRGAPPTHPELLDYLAATFMEPASGTPSGDGGAWSVKRLQRMICTSSTYRMSSKPPTQLAAQVDPDNKYLSHFPRLRLDSDELFDAMFTIRNIMPRQPSGQPLDVDKAKGRAMYVLTSSRVPEGLGQEVRKMFALFDYDASGVPIAERPTSQTPAQSLFWLNSPLVKYYADKFGERLLKMDRLDDAKRVEQAYLIAFGRPPSAEMTRASLAYLDQCEKGERLPREQAWSRFCQALFGSSEFRYVD